MPRTEGFSSLLSSPSICIFVMHLFLFMYSILLSVELVITSNILKKFYIDSGYVSQSHTIHATPFSQMSCYYSRNFYEEFEASLYQILTREISMSL